MAVKQTAGRTQLGEFAPKFAELNDDVLFGEVWSREEQLSLRDRSLVTVVALMAQGLTDESFKYHLQSAKANGITKEEIAEIVTAMHMAGQYNIRLPIEINITVYRIMGQKHLYFFTVWLSHQSIHVFHSEGCIFPFFIVLRRYLKTGKTKRNSI